MKPTYVGTVQERICINIKIWILKPTFPRNSLQFSPPSPDTLHIYRRQNFTRNLYCHQMSDPHKSFPNSGYLCSCSSNSPVFKTPEIWGIRRCVTFHGVGRRLVTDVSGETVCLSVSYPSISQPPARGPVPGPGINYTGPREVLLEFVILVF